MSPLAQLELAAAQPVALQHHRPPTVPTTPESAGSVRSRIAQQGGRRMIMPIGGGGGGGAPPAAAAANSPTAAPLLVAASGLPVTSKGPLAPPVSAHDASQQQDKQRAKAPTQNVGASLVAWFLGSTSSSKPPAASTPPSPGLGRSPSTTPLRGMGAAVGDSLLSVGAGGGLVVGGGVVGHPAATGLMRSSLSGVGGGLMAGAQQPGAYTVRLTTVCVWRCGCVIGVSLACRMQWEARIQCSARCFSTSPYQQGPIPLLSGLGVGVDC